MSIYFSSQITNCGQLLAIVPQQSGTAPSGGYDQLVAVTSIAAVAPVNWSMAGIVYTATGGGWAHVQKAVTVGTGPTTSQAATFTTATPAGHLVVCSIAGNATSMTVADSAGNTWTQRVTGGYNNTWVFDSVITNAGTLTVTATGPAGSFILVQLEEYSASGTIAAANSANAVQQNSAAPSVGPIAFSGTALVHGFAQINGSDDGQPTPRAGYTLDGWASHVNNVNHGYAVIYKLNDTSGSATPGVTYGGSPTLYKNGTPIALGPAVWDEGGSPDGGAGSMIGFLLTGGPVLATDVMTVDIPANFVNGSSPAVTGGAVTNNTGRIEKAFGSAPGQTGCPGLDLTPTMGAGANPGHPMVANFRPNFLPWNQCLRAGYWTWATGSSGTLNEDVNGVPSSWTAGQTIRLVGYFASSLYQLQTDNNGSNGLDNRGAPNQPGKWTLVWDDSQAGTANASTVALNTIISGVTCTLSSSTTVGTTTTAVYNVQYTSATPTEWDLGLVVDVSAPANNTGGSDGLSHWALGMPGTAQAIFLSPPNAADGTAMTVVRTNPFAINPNVRTQLTGGGKTIENLRAMESLLGNGSVNNKIYECDLPNINGYWATQRTINLTANHARFCNTNPAKGPVASGGDGTYNWAATTKVYGPQADFVLTAGNNTYNVTATLTSGSINITLSSGTLQLAGSTVTGTGIAAGTRIAYFAYGGTTTAVLSKPATASGSMTLTITDPGYLSLQPGDSGGFAINGYGQNNWAVCELRFDLPHGLTTGHMSSAASSPNGNTVALSGGLGNQPPAFGYAPFYVTGPDTIVMTWSQSGGSGLNVQTITATTEYDFTSTGSPNHGLSIQIQAPYDPAGTLAYEGHIGMCADLGCHAHLNLPGWGTDELYQAIGRMAHAYGGNSIHFRLEREDEPWDGSDPFFVNLVSNVARQNLYGQQASGTVISAYFTATGSVLPYYGTPVFGAAANVLLSGHMSDAFQAGFVGAGGSGSRVERVINCQVTYTNPTSVSAGALQQWGVPCDWFVVGPYISTPQPSTSISTAFSTSGGNWSCAAINDFNRLYWLYNYTQQGAFAGHAAIIASWGQPTQVANFSCDTGTTGGSFSPFGGGYKCWYTFLDSSGHETTVGQSPSSGTFVGVGNVPTLVMPPAPKWVSSINVYISGSGDVDPLGAGSYLYRNLPYTTYPAGTTVNFTTAAPTSGTQPPTTNGAAASAGTPPKLASYEGGQAQPIPTNVASWQALTHDCMAHPSYWLTTYTWLMSCQIGCQWSPGSGLQWADWYGVWSAPGPGSATYVNEYIIYAGIGQVAGQGLSNQYALKGPPADGKDHNGGAPLATGFNGVQVANQCPGGYGLQRWLAGGAAPAPALAVSPTSASATDGGAPVSITATLTNSTAALAASLSGAGSISTTAPTSGTPFTYTPPTSGTGTATVTVSDATDSLSEQCTISYAPGAAPTVAATTPANGAVRVPAATTVVVVFSADMQPASLGLTLEARLHGTVSCTLASYNSTTYTAVFSVPSSLANGTTYTATASGTSAAGFAMTAPYQWNFTTVYLPPAVASVTPTNGQIGVPVSDVLTATLSGAVNPASIAFTLTAPGDATVTGTTSYSDGVATFTPSASLIHYTRYSATVTATAPDGTAMSSPFAWFFTAQANPPVLTATTPPSGQAMVGVADAIAATFDETIDPQTLSLTLLPSARVGNPTWDATTNTATWTLLGTGLAYATSYQATASAAATDGTTMTAPYQWSFATHQAPPTGQGVLGPVGCQFTGPIDATDLLIAVTVAATGEAVTGAVSYDPDSYLASFTPNTPFTAGTKCLVAISGVKTTGGGAMDPIEYTIFPGPQRDTGWVGGIGPISSGGS